MSQQVGSAVFHKDPKCKMADKSAKLEVSEILVHLLSNFFFNFHIFIFISGLHQF